MPIFEYACGKCGHRFELLVQGSTVPECPSCKSRKLDKQLSVFSASSSSSSGAELPPSCQRCENAGGCMMNQH